MSRPQKGESLFEMYRHAGSAVVGEEARVGTQELVFTLTSTQMKTLCDAFPAMDVFKAWVIFLEEAAESPDGGFVVDGWGREWLIARGYGPSAAKRAVSFLNDAGYVISGQVRTDKGRVGGSRGTTPGGLLGVKGALARLAVEAAAGFRKGRRMPPPPVVQDPANGHAPVDNTVGRDPSNGVTPMSTNRPTVTASPQVSADVREPSNGQNPVIHSPSRSEKEEEEEIFLRALRSGSALTRDAVANFLANEALARGVATSWETVLVTVIRAVASNREALLRLASWLDEVVADEFGSADFDMTARQLAGLLVDIVRFRGSERDQLLAELRSRLAQRVGSHVGGIALDDFAAGFVAAVGGAVSAKEPVKDFGAWFGRVLRNEKVMASKATTSVLRAFADTYEPYVLLGSPAGALPERELLNRGEGRAAPEEAVIDELREAARGTIWEDAISFEKLLRNPVQRSRLLTRYRQRGSSGEHSA